MRFVLSVGVLAGFVSWLTACSCKQPPEPKQALEGAAAVFLGEVTKIEEDGNNLKVTLKVEKWWKGGDAAELTVSTAKDGATCGYTFEKGTKHLVYASSQDQNKTLRVSLCSRTRTDKRAEKDGDFKELGEGKAPKK